MRPWCEHHGFVDRTQLKTWLRGATLLALPSLEDNCPMTVLEAAAAGVPVMAANVGGVPDLVADGKTGLLCDPLDAASMGGAVEKFWRNRNWRRVGGGRQPKRVGAFSSYGRRADGIWRFTARCSAHILKQRSAGLRQNLLYYFEHGQHTPASNLWANINATKSGRPARSSVISKTGPQPSA